MPTGTVKWFSAKKGYGFIQLDDGSKDVFVHITAVERSGLGGLNERQKLAYEIEAGRQPGKSSAVDLGASPNPWLHRSMIDATRGYTENLPSLGQIGQSVCPFLWVERAISALV